MPMLIMILQRAIDNGQVEGFPSPDEVRTFYVEHDVDGDETENSIVSFVLKDKRILKNEAECRAVLETVGFTPERQESAIGSLSGGWKMKLALARAILFEVSHSLCSIRTGIDAQTILG